MMKNIFVSALFCEGIQHAVPIPVPSNILKQYAAFLLPKKFILTLPLKKKIIKITKQQQCVSWQNKFIYLDIFRFRFPNLKYTKEKENYTLRTEWEKGET